MLLQRRVRLKHHVINSLSRTTSSSQIIKQLLTNGHLPTHHHSKAGCHCSWLGYRNQTSTYWIWKEVPSDAHDLWPALNWPLPAMWTIPILLSSLSSKWHPANRNQSYNQYDHIRSGTSQTNMCQMFLLVNWESSPHIADTYKHYCVLNQTTEPFFLIFFLVHLFYQSLRRDFPHEEMSQAVNYLCFFWHVPLWKLYQILPLYPLTLIILGPVNPAVYQVCPTTNLSKQPHYVDFTSCSLCQRSLYKNENLIMKSSDCLFFCHFVMHLFRPRSGLQYSHTIGFVERYWISKGHLCVHYSV